MEGNDIFVLYKNNTFRYFFEENVDYEKPGFRSSGLLFIMQVYSIYFLDMFNMNGTEKSSYQVCGDRCICWVNLKALNL